MGRLILARDSRLTSGRAAPASQLPDARRMCMQQSREAGYFLIWFIRGYAAGQGMVFGLFVQNRVLVLCGCPKQGVYFVICPKRGSKMKSVVLNRVAFLGYFWAFFCPK